MKVSDLFRAFQSVADLGARVYSYYTNLEFSLRQKRQQIATLEERPPIRETDVQFWNNAVNTSMTICPPTLLQKWKLELRRIAVSLGNDNFLQATMDASSERLAIVKMMDIGPNHY